MKKKQIILLLFVQILFLVKANSQCAGGSIYIDSLKVLPMNYHYSDTIKIVLPITTPSTSLDLRHHFTIISNQINISACYYISGDLQLWHIVDTITLGVLPIGNYNLTVYSYCSNNDTICTYSGVFKDSISFSILPTGIIVLDKTNNYSFYPNPANDNITIDVSATLNIPAIIEITNIEGQVIKQQTTNVETTNLVVSALAKGMYFVKVKTEKGVAVKKFIKE